jgi:oxygen-independent coproporphyrinogen III oxidase
MNQRQFGHIDIDLLRRIDKPGPRYTSYPTAPLFSTEFTWKDFLEEIGRTNRDADTTDLSLYLHLPFCDTLCYFCGCTMIVTRNRERIRQYTGYLKREIELVARHISASRIVTQLHWGGGTPSYLEPDEIADLAGHLKTFFTRAPDIEAGVEIDPRGLTYEHMAALREAGFNRVSMGVQDFNEKVQDAVNRIQPESITRQAVEWSRQLGFSSINIDLIYGLPHQTVETFNETLDSIIDISPERLAVFNFAHVPWLKKHQQLIRPGDLPPPDLKLEILRHTIDRLGAAGYWYVGMDHFAKPGDELAVAQRNKTLYRNFQGYSTKAGCDLYGFGMSSISQFNEIYAQNEKTLGEYYAAIDEGRPATFQGYRMTVDDHIRRYVITRLMCDFELDPGEVGSRFGIDFGGYFRDSLEKLGGFITEGLVTENNGRFVVSPNGRLIIRNIAMCFDAYIDSMTKTKPIFSRTV